MAKKSPTHPAAPGCGPSLQRLPSNLVNTRSSVVAFRTAAVTLPFYMIKKQSVELRDARAVAADENDEGAAAGDGVLQPRPPAVARAQRRVVGEDVDAGALQELAQFVVRGEVVAAVAQEGGVGRRHVQLPHPGCGHRQARWYGRWEPGRAGPGSTGSTAGADYLRVVLRDALVAATGFFRPARRGFWVSPEDKVMPNSANTSVRCGARTASSTPWRRSKPE